MAKLSTERREALPASDFGLPGERKYPMPDRAHARDAKARASAAEHRGTISPRQKDQIDAKADRKLGKG